MGKENITAPVDSAEELDEFEIKTITHRRDGYVAGLIFLVAFAVYFCTSSLWAFPGQSSNLLSILTGVRPNTMPEHYLWQKIIGGIATLAGPNLAVKAATTACMVFSALSLGLAYLVSTAAFALLIETKQQEKKIESKEFHAAFAARLGGAVTTLTLAFSAPFWVAASRVNFFSIYLLWILAATYIMLRFMASGNVKLLYSFCLLYGMGMSQSSTMIQFMPLFVILAVMGMIHADRMKLSTLLLCGVISFVGWLVLFLVSLYAFAGTRGYVLMEFWGESLLATKMLRALAGGVVSGIPQKGWMIIIGLVILPWFAWLIVGFRTLNGESGPAINGLNVAILVVTLTVVLNTRVSPWQFFGFSPGQIVTYTMAAMTFGYCVTAAYMITVCLLSSKIESPLALASARILRCVLIGFVGLVLVIEVSNSYVHSETRNTRFLVTYVDRLLDNLKGRNWIVTDGVFDDMILLRAMERGLDVNLIDLASAANPVQIKLLKEKLTSARLKNSIEIGPLTFLQEWIQSDPDVTKKLVLCLFPDLWSIGDYRVYPHGLSFFGENRGAEDESAHVADKENIESYFRLMDEMEMELGKVSNRSAPLVLALADSVRRRVSFIGNNLGYFVETKGHAEEATHLYGRVHAFDPKNVSAMLNYASSLEKLGTEAQKAAIKAEIAEFKKNQKKPLQIWELSRTQGYVNSPEAFSYLGWTWAMSGQSTIALKTLSMALGNEYDYGTAGLMMTMADIHSRRGETEQTEIILETILKEHPEDVKSLLSLARLKMLMGDTAAAGELLDKIRATGIPKVRILREEASLKLAAGDIEGAKAALQDLIAEVPKDPDAHLSLYLTLARDFVKTEDNEKRNELRLLMASEIEAIMNIPEARFFQGAIARGHMRLIEKDVRGAREDFLVANKTTPGIVPILELILRMDYNLKDLLLAKQHAVEILQIMPEHPFANYIMGSIALSRNEFDSAEAYLQRSVERDGNLLATGDLAYVKFKLDEIDRALELVTAALNRSKDLYEVWDTYGQILLEQGKLNESEEALRMALKLNVQNPIVHLHLARVLFEQGRKEDSKNLLEQLQPFEASLYGDERRYYEALWQKVYGIEKIVGKKK